MSVEASAEARTRRAVYRRGQSVTFKRVYGAAPNVTTSSATVTAFVQNFLPDGVSTAQSGYAASQPGAIESGIRTILVMASDLADQGFPLPVRRGDKIVLGDEDGGEVLNVVRSDTFRRRVAGCIELSASGV